MAEMEVTQEGSEDPRTNMNQWMASHVIPIHCEVALQKRPLTNDDKGNHLRGRSRLLEEQQKDQIYTNYTPPTHATIGTRGAESDDDKRTIAKLQAELKRYKRKNKALKERLQEVLNLTELQKTLRMTLHSFGVPLPDTPHSRTKKCVSTWQGGDWRPEVVTLISEDEEEEEEEEEKNGESNDVQEYQEPLQSHGSCMYAYQPQESIPYFTSESNGEREITGAFDNSTNSLLNGGEAKETLHPQSQVELVPGHARNGFMVDPDTLNSLALKKGATYTLLTRNMMPLVFSLEEMTTSCVRGERARGKGARTSPARQALDQIKVQAVINFVRQKFPYVQSYQIIQTMNQKLVDVRSRIQKRRLKQTTTKRGGVKSPTK